MDELCLQHSGYFASRCDLIMSGLVLIEVVVLQELRPGLFLERLVQQTEAGMALVLDGLGATPWVLALLYLSAMVFIIMKLKYLHNLSPEMDTTKMFVVSVLLSCVMRCLSFVAIGSLSLQSIKFDENGASGRAPSGVSPDPDTDFYEKAVLVLFDLPDFIIISAYVLLALVWAEAFIQSRNHWLSVKHFRRMWLLSYLIFNACLYLGQLVLYTLLFLPNGNQDFLSKVIFLTLTIINFSLPVILLLLFLYLSIMFAGFPYRSRIAPVKLNKICKVVCWWTVGRIVWGIVVLTTILQGWLTRQTHDTRIYTIVLVGLFLITELVPFFTALDHQLLTLIANDTRAQGGSYPSYGSLPTTGNGSQAMTEGHAPHPPGGAQHHRGGNTFQRSSYGSEEGMIDTIEAEG